MKAISASIVILSAAILITGGSLVPHADTKLFVQTVGSLVGLLGVGGWVACMRDRIR